MKTLSMVGALALAALLQSALPSWTALGQAKAPLVLGIVIYYALNHGLRLTLQSAVLGGLLQDGLGLMPLGFSCITFCVIALVTRRYRDLVFEHEGITHALLGATAATGSTMMLYTLLATTGAHSAGIGWAFLRALGSGLLAVVMVPVVFRLMSSMDAWLGHLKPRYA